MIVSERPGCRTLRAVVVVYMLVLGAGAAAQPQAGGPAAPVAPSAPLASSSAPAIEQVGRELIALLAELADAERDPGRRLNLTPVLRRARDATDSLPQLRLASQAKRLPEAQRREALAALLPQVTLSNGQGRRSWTDASGGSGSGIGRQTSLTGKQLIYDFGASVAGLRAADRRLEAADWRFSIQRSELLLKAIEIFYETQRGLLQVRLARENLQARRSFVSYIVERADLGASSRADVVRAEARVAEALEQLASSLQRLANAQASYRQFYGGEAEPYVLPVEPSVEGLDAANIASLVEGHPQMSEVALSLEAARQERAAAKARMFGSLFLELSHSANSEPGRGNSTNTSAMIMLRSDLYAGGGQQARLAQADIRLAQAREEQDRARQELERALRESFAEYAGQVAAVSARLLVFRASEDSYAISKDLYSFSRSSLFEVFKAQEDLYAAGQRLIDSLVDRAKSKFRLLHAANQLTRSVETLP